MSPSDVSSSIISHVDDDGQTEFDDAMAALGPDSKHLYIICVHRPVLSSDVAWGGRGTEIVFPPKVFRMDIGDMSLSPMRPLPFRVIRSYFSAWWTPGAGRIDQGGGGMPGRVHKAPLHLPAG